MLRTIAIAIITLALGCYLPSPADHPIMHDDLAGWQGCTHDRSPQICLAISPDADRYIFHTSSGCQETGYLSGGLEFSPDPTSRLCLAPEPDLYSAAGIFTPSGITLVLDASPTYIRANPGPSQVTRLKLEYTL